MTQRIYLALLACLPLCGCGGDESGIAAAVSGTSNVPLTAAAAKVTDADVPASGDATTGAPAMASTQVSAIGAQGNAVSGDQTSAAGTSQSVTGSINRDASTIVSVAPSTPASASATAPITAGPTTAAPTTAAPTTAAPTTAAPTTAAPTTAAPTMAAPTISGSPAASAVAGKTYAFTPRITAASGASLTFSIQNAPSWATYNSTSGTLSGTPTTANIGTYPNIIISVSDGTHTATLPAFAIAVTQVTISNNTLSWTPPALNADGTTLGDLAGYRVSYGTSASALTQTLSITDPTSDSYAIPTLPSGTWYFSVAAYNSAGVAGNPSTVVEITL